MNNFNPYYYTQDFLDTLDKMKIRVQYAKLILLTYDEQPIKEIQGTITSGSLSINGASAVRRTINLTMSADASIGKITDLENLISLNKKVKVEVGFDTPIQYIAKRNEKITWFKQGTYVIASASISESTNGYNISFNGNDKMVMLNGVAGGTIPFTTILSEKDEYNEEGQLITTDTNLFQIIKEVVTQFGKEPMGNIIINDIVDTGKIYVKYIGNDTYYVFLNGDGVPITGSVGTYKGEIGQNWNQKIYQQGQIVGYFPTDLTWPDAEDNPLQAAAGETVVSILDKIKNVLGNYEYFYDIDGKFVFQQIRNWVNTTSNSINLITFDYTDYLRDYSKMPTDYVLRDKEQIVSISQNPKYDNIKNDFVVIGSHTMTSSLTRPIMYHVAIDKKPVINTQKIGIVEIVQTQTDKVLDEKGNRTGDSSVTETKNRWLCYSEDGINWYQPDSNNISSKDDIENSIYFDSKKNSSSQERKDLGNGVVKIIKTTVTYADPVPNDNSYTKYYTRTVNVQVILETTNNVDNVKTSVVQTESEVKETFTKFDNTYFLTRNIKQDEWREVLYQRALIENRKNSRSTDYDEELLGFWRDVYNPGNPNWDKYNGYCTNIQTLTKFDENGKSSTEVGDYASLVYWLDLIEPGAPLSSFSVAAIGRRTKTETDEKISTIYNQTPEDILYCFNIAETQQLKENHNNIFLLSQNWQPMFSEAALGESCLDRIRTLIYNHFTYNTAVSLNMIPRYYMEPNTLIELDLEDIKGKFQITQINLPLGYSGTMSLSLTETNQRG